MPKKILLVEDDPINVKFMQVVLKRRGGFDVLVSEDVEEIIQLAGRGDIAAIIMDISLSRSVYKDQKVDGIFITRLLKQNPDTAGIPIILATAHAMFGDKERFIEETGAEHYLSKPLHDPDVFLREVLSVLPKETNAE